MLNAFESVFHRLSSPFGRAIARQTFRRELGDGAILETAGRSSYQLEGIIGVGGQSVVYKATRLGDGRVVALKIVPADKEESCRRLLRHEARALERLRHRHIVRMLEHGETVDGDPYIAMEYVRGQTLDQLVEQEGGLKKERAIDICLQVAEALEYAHYAGVLHRDVKPQNIMVRQVEGADWVLLFDFGIAMVSGTGDDETAATSGSLLYAAPEQLKDEAYSARADIYQLALVLFEAMTGKLPFEISLKGAMSYRREGQLLLDDDELGDKALPAFLRELLERALSRQPEERQSSMGVFAHELREALVQGRWLELRKQVLDKLA